MRTHGLLRPMFSHGRWGCFTLCEVCVGQVAEWLQPPLSTQVIVAGPYQRFG